MLYFEIPQLINLGEVVLRVVDNLILVTNEQPPPIVKEIIRGIAISAYEVSDPHFWAKTDFYFIRLELSAPYVGPATVQASIFGFYLKTGNFEISDTRVDIWTDQPFYVPIGPMKIQGRGLLFDFICEHFTRLSYTHYILEGTK